MNENALNIHHNIESGTGHSNKILSNTSINMMNMILKDDLNNELQDNITTASNDSTKIASLPTVTSTVEKKNISTTQTMFPNHEYQSHEDIELGGIKKMSSHNNNHSFNDNNNQSCLSQQLRRSFNTTLHENNEIFIKNYVKDIFLFKNPKLFFIALSIIMMLLSLYLALWLTNYACLDIGHHHKVSIIHIERI